MPKIITLLLLTACCIHARAQKRGHTDTTVVKQKDAVDILYAILGKDASKRVDTTHLKPGKVYFSGAPGLAYSLQTGAAAVFASNFAFYTGDTATTKISAIRVSFDYTQKKQLVTHIQPSVWAKDNQYNFIGDYRYLKYPEDTYGIGGHTRVADGYTVDYSYLRFYQYALKKVATDFYAGLGIQYDRHWNIQEKEVAPGRITDFDRYGFSKTSVSSGIALNVLYNNVANNINPGKGLYANMILRQNAGWLGSDGNWNSAIIDIRKYISVGHKSNILALWSYDWLTLSGHPPYLDLPSNGWDTYGNTGRGYIQSRFAGTKMVYLEGEFRFGITRNGLFGGVVFANAASYTEFNDRFEVVQPAAGAGIRFKFNKFSRTNVAVDYAVGSGGSKGVFLNLGEVF